MRNLIILGAGTAGTMFAKKIHKRLPAGEWQVTIIDQEPEHYYQPGFLFLPFGHYQESDMIKPKKKFIDKQVNFRIAKVDRIDPESRKVYLDSGESLEYDYLVIASGASVHPEATPGMLCAGWQKNIHSFYTLEGVRALKKALESWQGGKLVAHIADMPIKCPVAMFEFSFLADQYFSQKGIRHKVDITYVTPLAEVFSKPKATIALNKLLQEKNIHVVTNFAVKEIDNENQLLRSQDNVEIPYDLLVTIPVNKGAAFIAKSGLGDEKNFVPVDKHTLQSSKWETIWAIGDAAGLPTSKAGSVAHFQIHTVVENILQHMQGEPMMHRFDGHANCYIESGYDKAFMIDFSYDVEPHHGKYPLPGIGPFTLLSPSWINHLGKLGFKWMYWNLLMPGRKMPIPDEFSIQGKQVS